MSSNAWLTRMTRVAAPRNRGKMPLLRIRVGPDRGSRARRSAVSARTVARSQRTKRTCIHRSREWRVAQSREIAARCRSYGSGSTLTADPAPVGAPSRRERLRDREAQPDLVGLYVLGAELMSPVLLCGQVVPVAVSNADDVFYRRDVIYTEFLQITYFLGIVG